MIESYEFGRIVINGKRYATSVHRWAHNRGRSHLQSTLPVNQCGGCFASDML